jgi:Asp-tRNA(Asn)/Glu-tRNA(Gln) amidotransferase C subunit
MTKEEIVKHIEHLKKLDLPELEKQGMISDWKKSLKKITKLIKDKPKQR